jgi:hypothetical protein
MNDAKLFLKLLGELIPDERHYLCVKNDKLKVHVFIKDNILTYSIDEGDYSRAVCDIVLEIVKDATSRVGG